MKSPRGFFLPGSCEWCCDDVTNKRFAEILLDDILETDRHRCVSKLYTRTATRLGNINDIALDDLQKRMLNSFSRHITTDADVSSRFTNLVRFVEIDDSFLASFQILSAFEVEL